MGPPLPLIFSYENSVYIQLKVPIEIISFFSVCFLYDLFIPSFQQLDSDLYLDVLFFFSTCWSLPCWRICKKIFSQIWEIFLRFFFFFPPFSLWASGYVSVRPSHTAPGILFLFSEYFSVFQINLPSYLLNHFAISNVPLSTLVNIYFMYFSAPELPFGLFYYLLKIIIISFNTSIFSFIASSIVTTALNLLSPNSSH